MSSTTFFNVNLFSVDNCNLENAITASYTKCGAWCIEINAVATRTLMHQIPHMVYDAVLTIPRFCSAE